MNFMGDCMANGIDRLNECYKVSNEIMSQYKKILFIKLNGMNDDALYNEYIEKIWGLILLENKTFNKLLKADVEYFLSNIDCKYHDKGMDEISLEYLKFRNKISYMRNKLLGYKLSSLELGLKEIPNEFEFDSMAAVTSMMAIKTLKIIKSKIYSLRSDNYNDQKFIDELNNKFAIKLLFEVMCNEILEVLGIFYDLNIDDIPMIDINILEQHFDNKLGSKGKTAIYDTIFDMAENTIKNILSIKKLRNNPTDVFNYVYLATKLEVIISYLDKDYLSILIEYLESLEEKEIPTIKNVSKLIRQKIKELGE